MDNALILQQLGYDPDLKDANNVITSADLYTETLTSAKLWFDPTYAEGLIEDLSRDDVCDRTC